MVAVVPDKNHNWPASSLWDINQAREVETETHRNKMENTNKILILFPVFHPLVNQLAVGRRLSS